MGKLRFSIYLVFSLMESFLLKLFLLFLQYYLYLYEKLKDRESSAHVKHALDK